MRYASELTLQVQALADIHAVDAEDRRQKNHARWATIRIDALSLRLLWRSATMPAAIKPTNTMDNSARPKYS
ncbi:hypothetical protein [uncultured Stenotrophomonas sp.]|uniref:hypothetical protein n=1 Tax=uncultured Stenotrophomonas sp. TaxID=165438 RepID=UPI0025E98349|nr:hypothetical protein [uncultured Stenotrophomonas sp.]